MDYQEVLTRIKALDLSSYPIDNIKEYLSSFGKIGLVTTTFHPGRIIVRARLNGAKTRFNNISDLSYKPEKFNTTYQRASTPYKTMFYGSVNSVNEREFGNDYSRITTLAELSDFARNKETVGFQKITYSAWVVKKDINLLSIVHHSDFKRPQKLIIDLNEQYQKFFKGNSTFWTTSKEITEFIANEFAKPNYGRDYEYLISALYTEKICDMGFDGILYPSVKMDGDGINVAIKPETVDSKLEFISASENTLCKNKMKMVLSHDTESVINIDGTLKYIPINNPEEPAIEICKQIVGLI